VPLRGANRAAERGQKYPPQQATVMPAMIRVFVLENALSGRGYSMANKGYVSGAHGRRIPANWKP